MKKNILLHVSLLLNVFFIFFFSYQVTNPKLKVKQVGDTQSLEIANVTPRVIGESVSRDNTSIVSKVVDGDTIKLDNGQVVRYIGIDTPETVDSRKSVQCYGKEASNENKKLVEGKSVRLEKDVSETDKFGRTLRYVWVESDSGEDIFVNDYLVSRGFARAVSYPPDVKYQNKFRISEQNAINNKLGLWNTCSNSGVEVSPTISQNSDSLRNPSLALDTNIVCTSNYYNCGDFKTKVEAQSVFDKCGGSANDIHKLDSDGDGVVCETLP